MNNPLEKHAEVFENLELTLAKIASAEHAISDAMILDELTDPLLTLAGGLANHATSRIGLGNVYREPNAPIRSIVAAEIIECTQTAYDKLIPFRNRAMVGLIRRFKQTVADQLKRLDNYVTVVIPRVRTAAMYGPNSASLSGIRIISDVRVKLLLGNAIDRSKHEKVSEMVSWILSSLLGGMESVAKDQSLNEYIVGNVNRFNQGDGFAPVNLSMRHDNPKLKYHADGFGGQFICGYFSEGLSGSKQMNPDVTDDIILEYPNLQDIVSTLESMSTAIRRTLETIQGSQLFPDEYVDETICDSVIEQSLDMRMYNTYYGDSLTGSEHVEVMINRIASIRLGQFSYLYYTLNNILNALPILMNYFIRSKIE